MQGKEEQALKIVSYNKYYAFSSTYIQTNEFLCYKGFFSLPSDACLSNSLRLW